MNTVNSVSTTEIRKQAEVVKMHTDLKVGKYWGEMGVDFWDEKIWGNELAKHEVLIMTPRILLDALRLGFFKMDVIKLLIFDECHNARGKSDYACIMKEFYHPLARSNTTNLPRIFGMTACLVKSKGSMTPNAYAKQILEFEDLMNSKVFTVAKESVLTEFVPFSTPKLKCYDHVELPHKVSMNLETQLAALKMRFITDMKVQNLRDDSNNSSVKHILRLCDTFTFCANDLGVWLAYQAAKSLSCNETEIYFWEERSDNIAKKISRNFSQAVCDAFSKYIPSGPNWWIGNDLNGNLDAGLLTTKVNCLIESIMGYRETNGLRCIIFVERVITAIVLQTLLSEVLSSYGWKVSYMAGSHSRMNSQRRNEHNNIIESFRKGSVNIIVATQILEEGLDVQRCNLVIRFDPSKTLCSFIQSRGRARMEGSEYLLIVKRGDASEYSRVKGYLTSGEIMREESLHYASLPCAPLKSEMYDEVFYRVETTGAMVSLNFSVSLIYYYCSQLPSDGYFKPAPRFIFDDVSKRCTLYLPKSCPLQTISVQGPKDILKKLACLEACKKLHEIGAITDRLLPESVDLELSACNSGDASSIEEQKKYFPGELICYRQPQFELYHCYLITMKQNFEYQIPFTNVILAVKCDLGSDFADTNFELTVNRGSVDVNIVPAGIIHLNPEQVSLSTKFQITVLKLLIERSLDKVAGALDSLQQNITLPRVSYLLLPSIDAVNNHPVIDWDCVNSLVFPPNTVCSGGNKLNCHTRYCLDKCSVNYVHTKDSMVCRCMLINSLVFTPHNGYAYCVTGFLDGVDGNSFMKSKEEYITYKEYYHSKYGIDLQYLGESLLKGSPIFTVKNCLGKQNYNKEKESTSVGVELPPELCTIIMSCISLSTLYSFSMLPSIMHRVESILLALNLKKLQSDHCISNINIPTFKVLEAITTKRCQEGFSLESLETLGDSFLKYAVSQQLFRRNKHQHEGLLSIQKHIMVSNNALFKLGCERGVQGFIRYESFDPKLWIMPGDLSKCSGLKEVPPLASANVFLLGSRRMKRKVVADVVEGLLGAYLITGGESAALIFMDWLGIQIDFVEDVANERHFISQPDMHVNVNQLECLLKHSFCDRSLLVEALTHASYQLPVIPRCYQRLEFLGDAVLDYLITIFMYNKYPGMSPGQLTDLRSSAVNNDCYALATVKAGLHKHVLHASQLLHHQIRNFVESFEQLSFVSTCGWESETTVPKVLGDVIESLAGAVLVDSGYNKDTVWKCIRPLLEPLVTPDTVKLHPVKELDELCQSRSFEKNTSVHSIDGKASITIEVEANGVSYSATRSGMNKKTAKKLAAKTVLEKLKAGMAKNY